MGYVAPNDELEKYVTYRKGIIIFFKGFSKHFLGATKEYQVELKSR
jgi:hypothetical protein